MNKYRKPAPQFGNRFDLRSTARGTESQAWIWVRGLVPGQGISEVAVGMFGDQQVATARQFPHTVVASGTLGA